MHHIYIHIPFCIKKCGYCNFYSITDLSLMDQFVEVLIQEIHDTPAVATSRHRGGGAGVETIFFGGGTPSMLSVDQFSKIYEKLDNCFTINKNCEFTVEVNPEDFNELKLAEFKKIGMNRISFGVQSFNDNSLKYLGRVHTAGRAREVLQKVPQLFDNWNFDLIYNLPHQSLVDIESDIKEAMQFSPRHISCYELTYEPGTPLYRERNKRAEDEGEAYLLIKKFLEERGYHQYEISNYSLEGFECRHNLAYWSDRSYLGLGPSAHSYDREMGKRWANTSSLKNYIHGKKIDFTEDAASIDKIITGLRKTSGMEAWLIPEQYRNIMDRLIADGLLEPNGGKIALTERGVLLSNKVFLEMMEKGGA